MSDVEKGTEVTPDEDFEGHKRRGHDANDEPTADASDSDFEGHKHRHGANDEPAADESDSDFEGHKHRGAF